MRGARRRTPQPGATPDVRLAASRIARADRVPKHLVPLERGRAHSGPLRALGREDEDEPHSTTSPRARMAWTRPERARRRRSRTYGFDLGDSRQCPWACCPVSGEPRGWPRPSASCRLASEEAARATVRLTMPACRRALGDKREGVGELEHRSADRVLTGALWPAIRAPDGWRQASTPPRGAHVRQDMSRTKALAPPSTVAKRRRADQR